MSGSAGWDGHLDAALETVRRAGQWRAPRPFDARGPVGELADRGGPVVSFASNDYLGLSAHPAVIDAAHAALDRWGSGSGSARLIVGDRPVHEELEHALAAWKGTPRAVLFPTGYQANLGALSALADRDTLVCSDELNHASIIDGCRLSRAEVCVYPHGDLDHLDALLGKRRAARAIVVSDAVFSMDGDVAAVGDLIDLTAAHDALLVLDEAHAVLGPAVPSAPHLVRVGTLSKALGALGGFVATTGRVADLIVNRSRPYIFTTASTPADAAAALAAVGVVRSPEGDALVARLRALVDRFRAGHPSPIVPVHCGSEPAAASAAAALLDAGFLVPAIRPPTVPRGTSRLRVTFSAAHTEAHVDGLLAAITELGLA